MNAPTQNRSVSASQGPLKARPSRAKQVFGWTVAVAIATGVVVIEVLNSVYEVSLVSGNMRWSRPWALVVLPLLLWAAYAQVKQSLQEPRLQISRGLELAPRYRTLRQRTVGLLTGLRLVALTLMAIALAGPQSLYAKDTAEVEGIDIMLALDVSVSMQAADIAPNRFEATQAVVDQFISKRPQDRIGAVVFGRQAYTLLPLTTDKEALRNLIRELQLGTVDGRGTAIGNALGVALNRLRNSKAKSKVLLLLTDGDSNSGELAPETAADFAKALGVKVYAVLMGAASEVPVQGNTDLFGRPVWEKRTFPINPELLQRIAKQTQGEYFVVTDRKGLEQTFHTILDRLEKSEIADPGRLYSELFGAFLGPAVLMLMLEQLLLVFAFRRWP